MSNRLNLNDKIDQIIQFAQSKDLIIRQGMVLDIVKDRDDTIDEEVFRVVFSKLQEQGITVVQEQDEGYSAEEIDADTFIPADVRINHKTLNVYNLMERLLNNEIDLSPGFQRHNNLWSLKNQSRLIESLMLKIPIPAFYFNAADEAKWIVIDGLQRLTAFNNFLVGKLQPDGSRLKEEFTGMQYLKEFNGLTYDDLPRQYMRRIKETTLIAFAVEKGTPEAVVYNIFQRINTGGVGLNGQEIRQALYQGTSTLLIQRLAESQEFKEATLYAVSSERMVDREYVTRFIAFTEMDYQKEYKGNIDTYLIKALKQVNNYDEEGIQRIERNFKRVMKYCKRIFGKYAFRKFNTQRRGPINKALFELWAVCFSELSNQQLEEVANNKEIFLEELKQLFANSEFITALKAGDQYSTVRRIELGRKMIRKFYD